ncbi:hypothetical protein [Micromonospora sp. C81]|uniref:hypothetical protein n=1 Tax=Micromonospora sp. C81 TaxID=2824881 RepID=UPI001B36C463|nr:hypothetical protein [Micromonospora sp. C81]MBQ1039292.1 hypothetical protein [Micromonospora sp. C81]
MGIRATSSVAALLPIGGQWVIEVENRDLTGYPAAATPTVVVTLPAGGTATPTFESTSTGRYRATYTVGTAGRYIARVTTTDDAVDFAAFVYATTAGTGMPQVADVVEYLGQTSHTEDQIQGALDAEAAAQRSVCRVGAVYPPDLREALLRRVARNLAMRQLPLAVLQGDAEIGGSVLPGRDPEIRRLEAPHRRLVIG